MAQIHAVNFSAPNGELSVKLTGNNNAAEDTGGQNTSDKSEKKTQDAALKSPKVKNSSTSDWTTIVVVQRCDEASLLVDNKDNWRSVKRGLVFYVSFRAGANADALPGICRTLLNLPMVTLGQWGDGSAPKGILQHVKDGHQMGIMIIPQASLVATQKDRGKRIQYLAQLDKREAEELYSDFLFQLKKEAADFIAPERLKEAQRKAYKNKAAARPVEPSETFQTGSWAGKFSTFDDRGVPLTDIEGKEVKGKRKKKVERVYQNQVKKYTKWVDSGGSKEEGKSVVSSQDEKDKDLKDIETVLSSKLDVVAGTFGNRQGYKLTAECGPMTHEFRF